MSNYPNQPPFNPYQMPQIGFSQQSQHDYPVQDQIGVPFQGHPGYPVQDQMGSFPQGQPGYPVQGQMGYPPQGFVPPGQGNISFPPMGFPPQESITTSSHSKISISHTEKSKETYKVSSASQFSYDHSSNTSGTSSESYFSGRPTIQATPNFNSREDAKCLYKAMKGLGTDEATIIRILSRRTFKERFEIAQIFKAEYNKDLAKMLKSEISGKFERVVLLCLKGIAGALATGISTALSSEDMDEKLLIQCLVPYRNLIIQDTVRMYNDLTGRNLKKDIREGTSGDFQKILVALLKGDRDENMNVDMNLVENDTTRLYQAGQGRLGTDEAVFTRIFARRSFYHIKALSKAYEKNYGTPLIKAIKKETSRDYEDALVAIVRFAEDKNDLLAKWLYETMRGAGTRDDSLMLMLIARSEIDLEDVKDAYVKNYGRSLAMAVECDTTGDYRKMLLGLIGE